MIEKIKQLQKELAEAKQDKDKASGALESITSRMKDSFGIETLKEAETLLREKKCLLGKQKRKGKKIQYRLLRRWKKEIKQMESS